MAALPRSPLVHPVERRTRPRRISPRGLLLVLGLAFFVVWTFLPIVWTVETALKPNSEIYRQASLIPKTITLTHFQGIIQETRFGTYFRNSMMVALLTTALSLVIGVLAAYALTRLSFTGRTFLARSVIVTYLAPTSLLFIPIFQLAYQLGLTDKALGLVVVYLIATVPFCTWLAISYFNGIPFELEDAALVDGANRIQALVYVILPLALPALAVIALFAFTNAWNEFLFSLLLIGRDSEKTIPAGLAGLINGDVFQWGGLMASALITSIPPVLIYVVAQRWVVSGLASGAVKG